uniref:SFRICE_008296 n=1 Tax=Spodoptera frugiperda TaxID=7108 RepID=A0A2H1WKD4_SPOFR
MWVSLKVVLCRNRTREMLHSSQLPNRCANRFSSKSLLLSSKQEQIYSSHQMTLKSLTANRKLLKANPPLTSVTGDHHGVQCVNTTIG